MQKGSKEGQDKGQQMPPLSDDERELFAYVLGKGVAYPNRAAQDLGLVVECETVFPALAQRGYIQLIPGQEDKTPEFRCYRVASSVFFAPHRLQQWTTGAGRVFFLQTQTHCTHPSRSCLGRYIHKDA